MSPRRSALRKIKDRVIECRRCSLYRWRKYPVVGQGNHQAQIVFVGEAPGRQEDATGHPFCGAAGKVLEELFRTAGLKREDVYITNILKCRPPQNRNPRPAEIRACSSYLERQLEIIQPKIIAALGNFALHYLLEKFSLQENIAGISVLHGKIFNAKASWGKIQVIALYHPAVVTYNPRMKEVLRQDFQLLKKLIKKASHS